MSTKRVDEVMTTWLLYDLTYRKCMPPHSLDFRINLGLLSLRKLQFSNYSAARSWSCQSPYSLGNTIHRGLCFCERRGWRRQAGEAKLLAAYEPSNLTQESPGPTAFWLLKTSTTQKVSPHEMSGFEREFQKRKPYQQYFHYRRCKTATAVSVAKRIRRANTPSSTKQADIYS